MLIKSSLSHWNQHSRQLDPWSRDLYTDGQSDCNLDSLKHLTLCSMQSKKHDKLFTVTVKHSFFLGTVTQYDDLSLWFCIIFRSNEKRLHSCANLYSVSMITDDHGLAVPHKIYIVRFFISTKFQTYQAIYTYTLSPMWYAKISVYLQSRYAYINCNSHSIALTRTLIAILQECSM